MEAAAEEPSGTDQEDNIVVALRAERSHSSSSPSAPTPSSDIGVSGEWSHRDEDDVCRICHGTGDSDNPLQYPCACRGSIKYVHKDCLLLWLNSRKISHCEVCKHAYYFVPLYAENTPARLPLWEFVTGIALKVFHVLQVFQRLAFYFFVLFMLVPFITYFLWELSFVKSFSEAQRLFLSYLSLSEVLVGCFHGLELSLEILLFLGAMLLVVSLTPLGELEEFENRVVHALRNVAHPPGNGAHAPRNVFLRFSLADIALAVLLNNMFFIFLLVVVPFSIGRIVSLTLLWLYSYDMIPVLTSIMSLTELASPLAYITLKNASNAGNNVSYETIGENVSGQVSEVVTEIYNTGKLGVLSRLSTPLSANQFNEDMVGILLLSDGFTIFIGYMAILSFIFCYARVGPLTVWRKFQNVIVTVAKAILSSLRKFVALLSAFFTIVKRHYLTMVKIAFILGIKVGAFPLMCGLWLDICTLRISGNAFAYSFLHWIVGIFYLIHIFSLVDLLQPLLHNRVLHFLPDTANPKHVIREWRKSPLHQHFCHILLLLAIHGSLMVMLVSLPIKLVACCAPSLFPLDFSETENGSFAGTLLSRFLVEYGSIFLGNFLYSMIEELVDKWLSVVCSVLGLSEFLLAKPVSHGIQGIRIVEPVRQYREHYWVHVVVAILEGSIVRTYALDNADAAEDNSDEQANSQFSFRIMLFLVLAWITMLLFNSVMMVLSILLGRPVSEAISRFPLTHGSTLNDLDASMIGSCVMVAIVIGARYAIEHVQSRRISALLKQIGKWGGNSVPLFLLILAIPVLTGVLFDLTVIVPMRVPLDESPVLLLLLEEWTIGSMLLPICLGLIMTDKSELFVERRLRMSLEKMFNEDFFQLNALWLMCEIVFPIMGKLLTALCVPYVFARGIFPLLGYPLMVNSAVYRFAWSSWLALCFLFLCTKMFIVLVIKLHNSIKDERYKIGQRLKNFEEDGRETKQPFGADIDQHWRRTIFAYCYHYLWLLAWFLITLF